MRKSFGWFLMVLSIVWILLSVWYFVDSPGQMTLNFYTAPWEALWRLILFSLLVPGLSVWIGWRLAHPMGLSRK